MLSVSHLKRRPVQFYRFTGMSVSEFDTLSAQVSAVYPSHRLDRLSRRDRQRSVGGGRRYSLSLEDRLLATLLYMRLYVTGALLSYLFDLHESNLCRERTQRMLPVLQEVLPVPMQDHLLSSLEDKESVSSPPSCKRRKRISTLEELLRVHPELKELVVDATEQEVPKPSRKGRQKTFYSGKSHRPTLKTQVTTCQRLVLHSFGGCPGSLADSTMLKASGVLPAIAAASTEHERSVRLDRGYSGIEKTYDQLQGVHLLVALKGTSRTRVTLLGRMWNQRIVAPLRMQVEQNIGHLKNWRLLAGRYRGLTAHHHAYFQTIAGLHNFKMLKAIQG